MEILQLTNLVANIHGTPLHTPISRGTVLSQE